MKQSKDFFWPSYVDLMTALFLTMLVLFVLSYKLFKDKESQNQKLINELQVQLEEKKKLDQIKKALERLESNYFKYKAEYKRYELTFDVNFAQWKYDLPEETKQPLVEAGRFLERQIQTLDDDTQYLVIVEGRAAKEPRLPDTDYSNQDRDDIRQLSYNRALAVLRLWESNGIQMPANVELVAAGSGNRGKGRYEGMNERLNRRFIIQIQPKIGSIGD